MHTLALGLAVVVLAAAPSFEEQKKTATTVERLASTVASLVGVCPDGLMADEFAECRENIGKAGKSFEGKKVYLYLGGGQEQFLSFGEKTGDRAKLVWAPIIDLGNGLALTLGKPQKLSGNGSVIVAKQPFEGFSDPGIEADDLQRAIQTGQVGIELVGKFGRPWQLNGKEPVRGVAFEVSAVRFTHTRTGKTLVEVLR
jgi:hypothetical protein